MPTLLTPHRPNGQEIQRFTLLRGLGALAIVIGHYLVHFNFPTHVAAAAAALVHRGAFLVDFFFIISGFVLYYVYQPQFAAKTLSAGTYLWRRFARIYPVHLFTLILAAAAYWLGGQWDLTMHIEHHMHAIWSNLLLLQAYGFEEDLWLNYPSWSVSAEFFAYLFVPVLITLICRVPARWAGVLAVVFFGLYAGVAQMLVTRFLGQDTGLFFLDFEFGIARIVPSFVLGLGIARSVMHWQLTSIKLGSMLVIGASVVTFGAGIFAPTPILLLCFGMMLGIFYLVPQRIATPKILEYLGTISYSIYMVHAIVEIVGFKLIEILFGFGLGMVPLWMLPFFVVCALVAAALTYHFVEVPGRKLMLAIPFRARQMPSQPTE